jgi:Flp pilus assembly pilin Flp
MFGVQEGVIDMLRYLYQWCVLKEDNRAVTALEYGLIAGLIVATIAIGFGILGSSLSNEFSGIGESL